MHMQQAYTFEHFSIYVLGAGYFIYSGLHYLSRDLYDRYMLPHTTFSVYLTSNIASEDVSVIEKIIQGYLGAIYFVTSLGLISHKMITCLAPLTNIGYLSYGLMIHLKLSASQKTPKGLLLTSNAHCKQLSIGRSAIRKIQLLASIISVCFMARAVLVFLDIFRVDLSANWYEDTPSPPTSAPH